MGIVYANDENARNAGANSVVLKYIAELMRYNASIFDGRQTEIYLSLTSHLNSLFFTTRSHISLVSLLAYTFSLHS